MKATRKVLTEMEIELCDYCERRAEPPFNLALRDETTSLAGVTDNRLAKGAYCEECKNAIVRRMGKRPKRARKEKLTP